MVLRTFQLENRAGWVAMSPRRSSPDFAPGWPSSSGPDEKCWAFEDPTNFGMAKHLGPPRVSKVILYLIIFDYDRIHGQVYQSHIVYIIISHVYHVLDGSAAVSIAWLLTAGHLPARCTAVHISAIFRYESNMAGKPPQLNISYPYNIIYPLVMTNSSPCFFDGPNRNRWLTY